MSMLERLSDARGTVEGKVVAVILAILLILPVASVTAFASGHHDEGDQVATEETVSQEAPTPEETPDVGSQPLTNTEEPTSTEAPAVTTPPVETPAPVETPVVDPVDKDQDAVLDAVLPLNIDEGATVIYNGNIYTVLNDEMNVSADQDTIFTIGANDGYAIAEEAPVVLVAADGTETELTADENGLYSITPEQVAQGLVLQVHAVKADTPEGEEGTEGENNDAADEGNEEATEDAGQGIDVFAMRAAQGAVKVAFKVNGGTGTVPASMRADKGDKIVIPEAPQMSRTNFELRGWAEIEDANIVDGSSPKITPVYKAGDYYEITKESGTVNLYAVWQQTSGATPGRIVITVLKRGLPSPPEPAIVPDAEFYKNYTWDGKNAAGDNMRDILFNTNEGWNKLQALIKTEAGKKELTTKWNNVDNILEYMNPVFTTTGATSVNGILTPKFWDFVNNINKTKKLWNPATEHVEFYAVKYQNNTLKYHIDGMIVPNNYATLSYEANAQDIQGSLPSNQQFQLFDGKASGKVADPVTDGNMTRPGYIFVGWNTKADGKGTAYAPGDTINFTQPGKVTLYAQWKVQYSIKYEWTGLEKHDKFFGPDQKEIYTIPVVKEKYTEGDTYTVDTHHKSGDLAYAYTNNALVAVYQFSGWMLNGKKANATEPVNSDLKFTGTWTLVSYKGTLNDATHEYDNTTAYIDTFDPTFITPQGITAEAGIPSYAYKDKDGQPLSEAPKEAGIYTVTANWPANSTHPEVTSAPARLVISQKPVVLLSASDSKTFDGTPLVKHEMEKVEGFIGNQGVDIEYTGTRTNPGTSNNTYTYTEKSGTNLNNYSITAQTGTLTINEREEGIPVILKAASKQEVYNGKNHTLDGLESVSGEGVAQNSVQADQAVFTYEGRQYTITGFKTGLIEKAVNVNVAGVPFYNRIVTDENSDVKVTVKEGTEDVDVTKQFAIEKIPGELTITPRPVTLKSDSAKKYYDGNVLEAPVIKDVDEILAQEADVKATGSLRTVDKTENTISVVGKANLPENVNTYSPNNYKFTYDKGTLEILPQSIDPKDDNGKDYTDPDNPYKGIKIEDLMDKVYRGEAWAPEQDPKVVTDDGKILTAGADHDYIVTLVTDDTTNVGTKIVRVEGTNNYNGSVKLDYKVTPAPVEVIVDSKSKKYLDPEPKFTGTIKGLFKNDRNNGDWDVLGKEVKYVRTNTEEDQGTYPEVLDIVVTEPNKNYQTPKVTKGDFTINAADAPAIIIDAESLRVTYDGNGHSISATADPSEGWNLQYAESKDGPWFDNPPIYDNADSYTVWVKTADRKNYNGAGPVSATLNILKKDVTITVNDASKLVGAEDPEFTGSIEGEVKGHELQDVNYARKGDSEAVGTYVDELTATYKQDDNYNVTVNEGDFTINPLGVLDVPGVPPTPPTPGPLETIVTTVTDFLATPIIGGPGAATTETIFDEETPLAQIEDEETPLSAYDHPVCWIHYYILLGIIITAIYGGGVIARRLGYNHKVKNYENDVTGKGKSSDQSFEPVSKEGTQPTI